MPNCLQTKAASSGESAMFFGESGSITVYDAVPAGDAKQGALAAWT